jgi:hypothetical protein
MRRNVRKSAGASKRDGLTACAAARTVAGFFGVANPLVQFGGGLWSIHHRDFRAGGLRLGTRTNVLRLTDGTIALHAPGPLDDADRASIAALGTVSVIVAPNLLHHFFLADVMSAFRRARLIAAPGIAERQPGIRVDEELGTSVPAALAGVAEMMVLDGAPKLEERVFFLPASRTLLAVDLAFNLRGMRGLTWLAMQLNGANDCFTVTRLARSRFIRDPAAAGRSVARMLEAWDFDRIVVSHGEVLETGGRAALRRAWSFALGTGSDFPR